MTAGSASPRRPELMIVADLDALAAAAVPRLRRAAAAAVARHGRFRLALAGGSTPRALYRALAAAPGAVDWTRADVFFGDERAVPPDHPDSNYRMAQETLLGAVAVPPANVHRMRGEAPDLDAAARDYEPAVRAGLDLVLLGMGADGHTASLFPGTTALDQQARLCVAVDVPQLATRRLTLTYPALLAAGEVLFLVAGADKAAALRDVLAGPERPRERPAQVVARRAHAVTVLCDRAAASLLPADLLGDLAATPSPPTPGPGEVP
jgi:6-phosphogluconolactonase